ncbi:hypothetical protein HanPSC8_Chr01g0040631 [Helianthus annuus]|nr:hypothetical protein HanPSC8_Chr01g0040631 [Helianthus annuus]
MISGARYSWVPTNELDRASVGSATSCGNERFSAVKSGFALRDFGADKSLDLKHETC